MSSGKLITHSEYEPLGKEHWGCTATHDGDLTAEEWDEYSALIEATLPTC